MSYFPLFLFPFLVMIAACMDLFTMRIPNSLNIAIALCFLPAAWLANLPVGSLELSSVGLHYACGLLILIISFAAFAFGKIGGGDAKLLASSAVWIGWQNLLEYIIVASLIGGVLALCLLALRWVSLPDILLKQAWIRRLHDPDSQVPYGVALAAGAVIIYPQTAIWLSAMGG